MKFGAGAGEDPFQNEGLDPRLINRLQAESSFALKSGALCIVLETASLRDFLEKTTIHLAKSSHVGILQSVIRRVCGFGAPDTFRPQVATLLSESVMNDRLVAVCSEALE